MSEAAITISGLGKSFRRKAVLYHVDWTVPAGSVVGLLGKNGAGKTTLLKCALGLIKAELGHAEIFGCDSWHLDERVKARIGYVPQTPGLYGWMRIGQLINYTAAFYPKWNGKLVDQLLSEWELGSDQRIGSLSVGTQQRLGIILALGHEPDLLVLDEPAASLDPAARREFLKAILTVAADGTRTVVFSTHITSDLERVADRVAVLKYGRIAYDGDLGVLKDSMKRWHLSAANALPDDLSVPGALNWRVEGTEAKITVRGGTEATKREAEARFGASIQVEDLTLEDIFLELHDERVG